MTGLDVLRAAPRRASDLPFVLFTGAGSEGIADAHGWSVTITESESGGTRFEIQGVECETPTPQTT